VTAADVIIVGGGHNGLVAAAYLARAGRRVRVLEARQETGGAVAGIRPFAGVDVRLSRFSYLVSLLPPVIVADLGLRLELRSRHVASYSPVGDHGLLVERPEGPATRESFEVLTGGPEAYDAWTRLYADLTTVAEAVAPTLTEPLPRAATLAASISPDLWRALTERPVGDLVEARLSDDVVRGVVLTDALIGTFASVHDPGLVQNRCFLYHVIGNGTGEWRVPVGGMGAVGDELRRAAEAAGAVIMTGAPVARLDPDADGVTVALADGRAFRAPTVLAGCAPAVLAGLLGRPVPAVEGSQLKINMVLSRLPRLRSGIDPETAFAGTTHLNQAASQLQQAYEAAQAGRIPDPLPAEVYCHTLTDRSILGPELAARGAHTLTLFGLHTPARLFRADPEGAKAAATQAALASLQSVLAEPLVDCLERDANGWLCLEAMTPLDLETELHLPGGHIFHGDLAWPWLPDDAVVTTSAERWGVATDVPNVLLCGSGARRGGAVSGLGGHNAAMALLEE
jgi:phytoene dehydrogenase-like protein